MHNHSTKKRNINSYSRLEFPQLFQQLLLVITLSLVRSLEENAFRVWGVKSTLACPQCGLRYVGSSFCTHSASICWPLKGRTRQEEIITRSRKEGQFKAKWLSYDLVSYWFLINYAYSSWWFSNTFMVKLLHSSITT